MIRDILTIPICAGWVDLCHTRRGLMDKRNLRRCIKGWAKSKGDAFVATVMAEAERIATARAERRALRKKARK